MVRNQSHHKSENQSARNRSSFAGSKREAGPCSVEHSLHGWRGQVETEPRVSSAGGHGLALSWTRMAVLLRQCCQWWCLFASSCRGATFGQEPGGRGRFWAQVPAFVQHGVLLNCMVSFGKSWIFQESGCQSVFCCHGNIPDGISL